MDAHEIIICPIVTESIFDAIESQNKLVFYVHSHATKIQVKKAVEELYKVKVLRVNTVNTIEGKKKAYVRLHPDDDAMKLASDFGLF